MKIINSIKNDTIKIYQENIYSFNVNDIQKKVLEESLHHLFFDISAAVTIILINFSKAKNYWNLYCWVNNRNLLRGLVQMTI